jgi:hypothetical protein
MNEDEAMTPEQAKAWLQQNSAEILRRAKQLAMTYESKLKAETASVPRPEVKTRDGS